MKDILHRGLSEKGVELIGFAIALSGTKEQGRWFVPVVEWHILKVGYSLSSPTFERTTVEPERFTGFLHGVLKQPVFENDVLIEIEETDEGDEYHLGIVTWISEWGMFTILGHSERVAYEDEGVEAFDDSSSYTIDQEQIDLYKFYKGNKYGLNWNEYLKEIE